MRKLSIIIIVLFLLPLFTWAQDAADILIFSAEGNVMISRNKKMIPCKRADKIIAGDIIYLKKGTITLVDRNLKRVSLEKKGNYSYEQIVKYFSQVNASFENRFLVQLLDKMINKPKAVSYGGGVVRGSVDMMQPMDSAIILSDSIRFIFPNPGKQNFTFFLLDDEHNVLFSKETTDSVLVIQKQNATWWKPGTYSWEAGTRDKQGSAANRFFIPANNELADLLNDYYRLRISFPAFSLKTRNRLMDEILKLNRWVMY